MVYIGSRLSNRALLQIQAFANYLRLGRWFRDHNFAVSRRVYSKKHVWNAIINRVGNKKVLYLEFGVASGESMKYWSRELKNSEAILHGFDSFEGLPEQGGPWRKGQFNVKGRIPEIPDSRIEFFKGWFDKVLPDYSPPSHEILVISLDADLYSSTSCVLRHLRPHIERGTYIYFDEMNHMEHEPRAFDELIRDSGLQFRLVSVDITMAFCCFECVG